MLELKDICFNVRQDSKEKEILKNKFLFLLQLTGKYCMIIWKLFTYEDE